MTSPGPAGFEMPGAKNWRAARRGSILMVRTKIARTEDVRIDEDHGPVMKKKAQVQVKREDKDKKEKGAGKDGDAKGKKGSKKKVKKRSTLGEISRIGTDDSRMMNLRKLHSLCKPPEERAESDILALVEVTTALCQFFQTMPFQMRHELCRVIMPESFVKGDIIFHQGDIGEKFYVIVQGKVEVKVHAGPGFNRNTSNSGWQTVAVLQRGDSFGELALLKDMPRTATIIVPTVKAELLTIHKDDFQRIPHGLYGSTIHDRARFLRHLKSFAMLPTRLVVQMAHFMSVAVFQAGTVFQTDRDNRVYFVVQGECRLTNQANSEARNNHVVDDLFYKAEIISRLGPGNFFGESCVFKELSRDWFVEAATEVKLYFLSQADFRNNIDPLTQKVLKKEATYKTEYYDARLRGREQIAAKGTKAHPGDLGSSLRPGLGGAEAGGQGMPRPLATFRRLMGHNAEDQTGMLDELEALKHNVLQNIQEKHAAKAPFPGVPWGPEGPSGRPSSVGFLA